MEGASGLEDSLFAHPWEKRTGEIIEQVLNSDRATCRVLRWLWLCTRGLDGKASKAVLCVLIHLRCAREARLAASIKSAL